jgi:tRNA dimethylallyltransferase
LAGGTGLYLRAALAPLAIPEVRDPELRARLSAQGEVEGPAALHARLARLDPAAAGSIHPQNLRRTVRALEVLELLGPGSWSGREDLWRPAYRYPTIIVGLVLPRQELYRRIDERTRQMLERGAVEEVRAHLAAAGTPADGHVEGAPPGCPTAASGVAKAIGYREIHRHLAGQATLPEVEERLAASTRRYARAQLTWLRKLEDAVIMDASSGPDETAARIVALLSEE